MPRCYGNAVIRNVGICLLFALCLMVQNPFAQTTNQHSVGYIKFIFNMMPDSLLLNDESIEVIRGGTVQVSAPGKYVIRAKLHSYPEIVRNLTVNPDQKVNIYLDFYKYSSAGAFIYKNSSFLLIAAGAYLYARNREDAGFILPALTLGAVQHLISFYLRRKRFQPGGTYHHLPHYPGIFGLYIEIPSSVLYDGVSVEKEVVMEYVTSTHRYLQSIDYNMLGDKVISHYGIQLGLETKVYKRISVSGILGWYPLARSKMLSKVQYSDNGRLKEESFEFQQKNPFYIFKTTLNILLFPIYDQQFYIHAGRFWGKTREINSGPHIVERKRDWAPVTYDSLSIAPAKVNFGGWDIGGSVHSPVNNHFYFSVSFDYLFNNNPGPNPLSFSQNMYTFSAGIKYIR